MLLVLAALHARGCSESCDALEPTLVASPRAAVFRRAVELPPPWMLAALGVLLCRILDIWNAPPIATMGVAVVLIALAAALALFAKPLE